MRKLALLSVAFALVAVSFYGCNETPTALPEDAILTPNLTLDAVSASSFEAEGGAIVVTSGDVNCWLGPHYTNQGTVVVTPSGNAKLDCRFRGLPYSEHFVMKDWRCTLCVPDQGCEQTDESHMVRTENAAQIWCHFNGNSQ